MDLNKNIQNKVFTFSCFSVFFILFYFIVEYLRIFGIGQNVRRTFPPDSDPHFIATMTIGAIDYFILYVGLVKSFVKNVKYSRVI